MAGLAVREDTDGENIQGSGGQKNELIIKVIGVLSLCRCTRIQRLGLLSRIEAQESCRQA